MNQTTKKSKVCFGIRSDTEDNKHIFMSDFDNMLLPKVYNILLDAQTQFGLSNIYIIETENGYNAFSLDKLELDFLVNILCNYSEIDSRFIALAKKRGFFVLRMGQEKRFLSTLTTSPCYYFHELSNAHKTFFMDIMDYPILNYGTFDNYNGFSVIAYKSHKNGFANINLGCD